MSRKGGLGVYLKSFKNMLNILFVTRTCPSKIIYQNQIKMHIHQSEIIIRPFQPSDQDAAKALVLEGLSEHFSPFRPELHPDLDDIQSNYDVFLVAYQRAELVGTGAFNIASEDTAKIMRMSTARDFRGQGIAGKILRELESITRAKGVKQLNLVTGQDWADALGFYQHYGFQIVGPFRDDTEFQGVWLEKNLSSGTSPCKVSESQRIK
jgi:GNAT superfamily N-acetyltransferase